MDQAEQDQSGTARRILCCLSLVLALILAPLATIASHGPGAYAAVISAVADGLAQGHSHDLAEGGTADHDATDHDHQTMAVVPPAAQQDRDAGLATPFIDLHVAAGRERAGPRRPPRSRA